MKQRYTVDPETGCWLWNGARHTNGYGVLRVAQRNRAAHRWLYEQHVGPIPEGLDLDHLCRVRACVNPAHLEPVTRAENLRRGDGTKLTETQAAEIKWLRTRGWQAVDIAALYAISDRHVAGICDGETWSDVPAKASPELEAVLERMERSSKSAGFRVRGAQRERKVLQRYLDDGWLAFRLGISRGEKGLGGVCDVVALKAGETPLFIEVKSTAAGPYATFGSGKRDALIAAAKKAGATPLLAHWPPGGELRLIDASEWPKGKDQPKEEAA